MFTERPAGERIGFTGRHVFGQRLKDTLAAGDHVTLRIGTERVLVRDLEILGCGKYAGIVYGFEPSLVTTFGGVSDGQRVEFDETNIFWCGER